MGLHFSYLAGSPQRLADDDGRNFISESYYSGRTMEDAHETNRTYYYP